MGDSRSEWRVLAGVAAAIAVVATSVVMMFWPALVAGYTNVIAADQLATRERIALQTHGVGPELVTQHFAPQGMYDGYALWSNCAQPHDRTECIRQVSEANGRFILTRYDRTWRGSIRDTQYAAVGFAVYTPWGSSAMTAIQTCSVPPDATFETLFSIKKPNVWGDCGKQP